MSVTFAPETGHLPHTYGVHCHTEGLTIGAVATYEAAQGIRTRHLLICEDCRVYGCYTVATPVAHAEAPSLNLSNSNAARVLALLGYRTEDLCGSATPADLADRAEAYLTLSESPAVAWDEYAVTRITALLEVASYAASSGLGVAWA